MTQRTESRPLAVAPAGTDPRPRVRRLLVLALLLLGACLRAPVTVVGPVMDRIGLDTGLEATTLGLLGALPASLATALTGGASGAAPADGTAAGPAAPGTGAALVESAKKYLGVPYVWGGESLSEGGLDCSGLVQLAMKDIGVDVPRVAREQMKIGTEVPSLDQARPGDLVVTRGGGHIGIYAGGNKWIHAPYPGEKVKLAEMTTPPTTIRRVLP